MSFPFILNQLTTSIQLPTYGLITVHLIDPFSLFMANLLHLPTYKANGIGYYYQDKYYLYPFYHNKYLHFLPSNLDQLIKHDYISRINFYQTNLSETDFLNLISRIENIKQVQTQYEIYTNILLHKFKLQSLTFQSSFSLFNQALNVEVYFKELNETGITKIDTMYNKNNPTGIHHNYIEEHIISRFDKLTKTFINLFISNSHYRNIFLTYHPENTYDDFLQLFEYMLENLTDKVVDLSELVKCYNKCRSLDLMTNYKVNTVSSYETSKGFIFIEPNNSLDQYLATNSTKLDQLTYDELISVLLYLESMRANDGTGDVRFNDLQNRVSMELAGRKKL